MGEVCVPCISPLDGQDTGACGVIECSLEAENSPNTTDMELRTDEEMEISEGPTESESSNNESSESSNQEESDQAEISDSSDSSSPSSEWESRVVEVREPVLDLILLMMKMRDL